MSKGTHGARLCWRRRILPALLLLVFAGVSACTPAAEPAPPSSTSSPTATRPANPVPPDRNLRDVSRAMIYSDGIAHVLDETAAQMICGALAQADWQQVFGGAIGRTVYGGVGAKCVISTGTLTVEIERIVKTLGTAGEGELIAGRRVEVDTSFSSKRVAAATAALVPLGEQDITEQQRIGARPVLDLLARTTDIDQNPPDLPALLRRLLTALLPKLTPVGPATPVYDAASKLAFTPTEPVPGVPIYDLPRTVQALILCTAVLGDAGLTPQPAEVFVNSVAECSVERLRVFAKVDQFLDPTPPSSPYRIVGRPAEERADIGIVINLLAMPGEYDHTEHLTLRLTNHAPPARLRAWAEKIAARLLTA